MAVLLVLSVIGLAVAATLFLRARAVERRPELRLTREHELVRQAAEYRQRQAEAEAMRSLTVRPPGDDASGPIIDATAQDGADAPPNPRRRT